MDRWKREQSQRVHIELTQKEADIMRAFAYGNDGRNSFVKLIRSIAPKGTHRWIVTTKQIVCILHAVAWLMNGKYRVIQVLRKRFSPVAIPILKSWRS